MNFEDLRKAWQCQKSKPIVTINAEALVWELRLSQLLSVRVNFFADMFIVAVEAILVPWFLYSAIRFHDWANYLMASACFFIGVFILVDRWIQRRKRPLTNDSLASCIKSSLVEVKHEIWRSKNIFWWYVLPLEIGFAATVVSWLLRTLHESRAHAHVGRANAVELWSNLLGVAGFGLFCALLGWIIYWGSRRGLKKVLEPRRKELEDLLAGLNENVSDAGEPPPSK
jgi:hypothetical protein